MKETQFSQSSSHIHPSLLSLEDTTEYLNNAFIVTKTLRHTQLYMSMRAISYAVNNQHQNKFNKILLFFKFPYELTLNYNISLLFHNNVHSSINNIALPISTSRHKIGFMTYVSSLNIDRIISEYYLIIY